MKITKIDINKLVLYEKNNKLHNEKQIKILADSISEYGFNYPVIIDKNNIVIAGHGRIEASKLLGLKEVPVIIKGNLTEKQIKKYRLLDNKIAELAEDNIENIKFELEELKDLELDELYNLDIEEIDFDNIEGNEDREVSDKTKEVECPSCGEKFNV